MTQQSNTPHRGVHAPQAGSSRAGYNTETPRSRGNEGSTLVRCVKACSRPTMGFDNAIMELGYKEYASQLLIKYDVAVCIMHSCFMLCMLKVHVSNYGMNFSPFGAKSTVYMLLRLCTVLAQACIIWRAPLRYLRLRTGFVGSIRVLRYLLASWHGDELRKTGEKSLLHAKFTSGGALVLLMILPLSNILPVPNHVILQLVLVLFALPRLSAVSPGSRVGTILVKRLCVAWGRLTYWPCRALGLALPPTSAMLVPDASATRATAILTAVLFGFMLPTVMTFAVELKMRSMYGGSGKRQRENRGVQKRLEALPEACTRQLKWISALLLPALLVAGHFLAPPAHSA